MFKTGKKLSTRAMKFRTIKKKFNSRLTQEPERLKFPLGYRRGNKKTIGSMINHVWQTGKTNPNGGSVLIFKEKRCRTICFCGGCRRRRHVLLYIPVHRMLSSHVPNTQFRISFYPRFLFPFPFVCIAHFLFSFSSPKP